MTVKQPPPLPPQKPPPAKAKPPAPPPPDMLADMSAFGDDELEAPEGTFDPDYIAGKK